MSSDVYIKSNVSKKFLEAMKLGIIPDGTYIGFSEDDFYQIVDDESIPKDGTNKIK